MPTGKRTKKIDSLGRRITPRNRRAIGLKAAKTIKERYGEDFYVKMGKQSGLFSTPGYFGHLKYHGLTKKLIEVSRKGGLGGGAARRYAKPAPTSPENPTEGQE